jgi:2-desacetyl-2-hydroxyethyl bacteriochlorophyllide A dehydrogenase
MSALRWHARRDVRLQDIAIPEPAPHEVLIQVELCGICGTDVEEYRAGPIAISVPGSSQAPPPVVLGHEVVGTVAGHGADVDASALAAGTRVVPDVVVGCGRCWWCRRHQEGLCAAQTVRGLGLNGGLAQFMVADAATCVIVPPDVPVQAATFAEPAAVAVRAVRKAGDLAGATVLVIGAGTIGLLIAQVARAAGAHVIATDIDPARRALAAKLGADPAEPDALAAHLDRRTQGRGADVVFECTGAPDQVSATLRHCRRGGSIILVGISNAAPTISLPDLVLGEKRLIGTAAHLWDEDVTTAVRLIASGTVDPLALPYRIVGLAEAADVIARPGRDGLKILVAPGAGQE